jgi:hypothetical protein
VHSYEFWSVVTACVSTETGGGVNHCVSIPYICSMSSISVTGSPLTVLEICWTFCISVILPCNMLFTFDNSHLHIMLISCFYHTFMLIHNAYLSITPLFFILCNHLWAIVWHHEYQYCMFYHYRIESLVHDPGNWEWVQHACGRSVWIGLAVVAEDEAQTQEPTLYSVDVDSWR